MMAWSGELHTCLSLRRTETNTPFEALVMPWSVARFGLVCDGIKSKNNPRDGRPHEMHRDACECFCVR